MRYPHSPGSRTQFLPIAPHEPHRDLDGCIMELEDDGLLSKPSYIFIGVRYEVPLTVLENYRFGGRHGPVLELKLTQRSLKDLNRWRGPWTIKRACTIMQQYS